jgi:hypothetical protein
MLRTPFLIPAKAKQMPVSEQASVLFWRYIEEADMMMLSNQPNK